LKKKNSFTLSLLNEPFLRCEYLVDPYAVLAGSVDVESNLSQMLEHAPRGLTPEEINERRHGLQVLQKRAEARADFVVTNVPEVLADALHRLHATTLILPAPPHESEAKVWFWGGKDGVMEFSGHEARELYKDLRQEQIDVLMKQQTNSLKLMIGASGPGGPNNQKWTRARRHEFLNTFNRAVERITIHATRFRNNISDPEREEILRDSNNRLADDQRLPNFILEQILDLDLQGAKPEAELAVELAAFEFGIYDPEKDDRPSTYLIKVLTQARRDLKRTINAESK